MLGWDEIREMSTNQIEIGAHTVTHPDLAKIDLGKAKNEILASKEEIEKQVAKPCRFFAFPFSSYNKEVLNSVLDSGFQAAIAGQGINRKGTKLHVINRISINNSLSPFMLRVELSRATEWYIKTYMFIKRIMNLKSTLMRKRAS